jgi:circadian clock protein KaiC
MSDSLEPSLSSPNGGERVRTGVPGLDEVLAGGLTRDRLYLVEGLPGSGKTTLGLQFLLEGRRAGLRCMYVTLSEAEEELRASAASHGWSLDGIAIFDLQTTRMAAEEQTLLHPAEFELGETTGQILARIDAERPERLVIDTLSELRVLAHTPLRYRGEFFALKQHLKSITCTTLMLDDKMVHPNEMQVQTIVHGVIALDRDPLNAYGSDHFCLRVVKMRGLAFRSGSHDFAIETGGIVVYPRIGSPRTTRPGPSETLSTGVAELDLMLGGGLCSGASTLIMGPTGTGKTSTATRCLLSMMERGVQAAIFNFDESPTALLNRSAGLGMALNPLMEAGRLRVNQMDPAELSPGKFAQTIRTAVEVDGVRALLIDSLNGYYHAFPDEKYLMLQMHELLSYLNGRVVATLLVLGQQGLANEPHSMVDLSYLSDTLILQRFFEAEGELHRGMSVLKTRWSKHECTIREFTLGPPTGLTIGPVLRGFEGILTGSPTYRGTAVGLTGTSQVVPPASLQSGGQSSP